MKSFKKVITSVGVLLTAALLVFTFVGCDSCGKKVHSNPEERPLVMSISTPDRVFNPFFSTSGNDSTVIGMTQVSMLGSDHEGNPVCGDDEPVVVKDYTINEKYAEDGKTIESTTYKFIIKNGIKFSDGTDLTIKDVLFNLYVYLDPVYTGSVTMYSTDIKGLNAYRTQDPDASDTSTGTFEETFITEANEHIDDLVEFMRVFGVYSPEPGEVKPTDRWTADEKTRFKNDFADTAKEFRNELISDYNAALGSMETYEDWGITDAWQAFLINDGGYTHMLQTDSEGVIIRDENGNPQLNKEEADKEKINLDEYLKSHKLEDAGKEAKDAATREWAVNTVFMGYFTAAIDIETMDYVEAAFDKDHIDNTIARTGAKGFTEIIRAWNATSSAMLTKFIADAKSDYFSTLERKVLSISGITTSTTSTDYHGNNLGASHDVLEIEINGVDPKAIWNFGFTVAPMNYYSGTFKNKNYIELFNPDKGEFGVAFGNSDFMNSVVNAPSKIGLPVGAGVYMASTLSGGRATSGDDFMNLNMIYYERNPYFTTLGSGIDNAKIKYFRYQVVETDQVINSIATGAIDVGEPNATQDSIRTLDSAGISHIEIRTAGYGYIGINPRFVPNINVRRAIMKAMNRQLIFDNYYQGNLAEKIERPMSTVNWAYPKGATVYTNKELSGYKYDENGRVVATGELSYEFDDLGDIIEKMVTDEGYTKGGDGVYTKNVPGFGDDKLDYQFTIAGGSSDHPAYNVFAQAVKLLNAHGFNVKLVTSLNALTDLSAGKLEVWAAAWSSTLDPDMYQVYHMDSQAQSVNNWGYTQIKAGRNGTYSTEYEIITQLSEQIDLGRSVTDEKQRAIYYSNALDLVMELAVELPTYQRSDMTAFNSKIINEDTLTPKNERSPYNGLFARIWEVNYN